MKDVDITDGLSVEQLKELKALSNEYETKDTHGIDDFNPNFAMD